MKRPAQRSNIQLISFSDWTANFDSGAAMDTLDAAAVGWVSPDATITVGVEDEAGFADFTDISKFERLSQNSFSIRSNYLV